MFYLFILVDFEYSCLPKMAIVTVQLDLTQVGCDYIMGRTAPHVELLGCFCAADWETIGDSTSLLTTYRATKGRL